MALQSNELPLGQIAPASTWGEANNISFLVQQALGKLQTLLPVRVLKCTNSGGVSAVGFVDVQPLVNQIDGQGNAVPHVTIYNVPYARVQGGANAIICDPAVGDIGIAGFASRDITKVKNTRAQGNPGSKRRYDFADAMYICGLLNGAPTQYVQFNAAGIVIKSPILVKLDAPAITINGPLTIVGNLTQTGNIALNGNMTATGTIHALNIP